MSLTQDTRREVMVTGAWHELPKPPKEEDVSELAALAAAEAKKADSHAAAGAVAFDNIS